MLLHLGLNIITLRTFIIFTTKCYYTCAFNRGVHIILMYSRGPKSSFLERVPAANVQFRVTSCVPLKCQEYNFQEIATSWSLIF